MVTGDNLRRVARTTGLLYLLLGVSGMIGFLAIRPALFDPGDAAATLANVLEKEQIARFGIALEFILVIAQSLAALWFYRLFRGVDQFGAVAIMVFGLFNSVAILVGSAMSATALQLALGSIPPDASHLHLLFLVGNNLVQSGNLFFGLWLIPMGGCVLRSGWMPRMLGRVLIAGGIGYVLMPFVVVLLPDAGYAVAILPILATVGEFWMIGYLLIRGVSLPTEQPGPT